MKKILHLVSLFITFFFTFSVSTSNVYAQSNPNTCNITVGNVTRSTVDGPEHLSAEINVTGITVDGTLRTSDHYDEFYFWIPEIGNGIAIPAEYIQNGEYTDGPLEIKNQWNINEAAVLLFPDPDRTYTVQLVYNRGSNPHTTLCSGTVSYTSVPSCSGTDLDSSFLIIPPSIDRDTPATLAISNVPSHLRGQTLYFSIPPWGITKQIAMPVDSSGNTSISINVNQIDPATPNGVYNISIIDQLGNACITTRPIVISGEMQCRGIGEACSPQDDTLPTCNNFICLCAPSDPTNCHVTTPTLQTTAYNCDKTTVPPVCKKCTVDIALGQIISCEDASGDEVSWCGDCSAGFVPPPFLCPSSSNNQAGIDTAIGCIPFIQPELMIAFFVRWSVRIGGGVAMLIFIAAALQFITSSGNPDKIQSAKDLFIAGVSGLLMIIFSIFLLQLIGFNILGIFTQ